MSISVEGTSKQKSSKFHFIKEQRVGKEYPDKLLKMPKVKKANNGAH